MLPLSTDQINEFSTVAFRVALRVTGEREAALDIAQEVLVGALECRLKDPTKLRAYVVRSAMNRALNAKRDEASHKVKLAREAERMDHNATDFQIQDNKQSELVHSLLEKLAEKQREALMLRFFADMRIGAISRAMGISEGAVKTHLIRGLANLRTRIEDIKGVTQ